MPVPRKRVFPKPTPRKTVIEDASSEYEDDIIQMVNVQVNDENDGRNSEVSVNWLVIHI